MDRTSLSPIVFATVDPRYLNNLNETLKKLVALGLSLSEIEELFLNPSHHIYITSMKLKAVWLVELELKENGAVDILKGGRSVDSVSPQPGSREALDRQIDKTIIHPIEVIHACTDLDVLASYRELINEERDFLVLFYRISKHHIINRISIQVKDCDLTKLEVYADKIHAILGDSCQRVFYHSFEPYIYSPDSYFSKGFPTTKCGLVIHKLIWEGNRFRKTKNDPTSFFSYLLERNCSSFQTVDDNPEFWKVVFETSSIWGDNLYKEMLKDGFRDFRLYTDVNLEAFIREKYTGIHFKVVSFNRSSDIDDEDTVMRALSNGQGEFYGRD